MEPGVDIDRDGAVAVVTIRDPARRNALSAPIRAGLIEAFTTLMRGDDDCRAILLTGAGGSFCSGGDISTMEGMGSFSGRARLQAGHALVRLMVRGEKPIVAAVEGYAFGAGFSLALLCDHVVAARDARFGAAFGKLGLMPDMGLLWTLPQRVGIGKARRLMMLSEPLTAEEAAGLGIVGTLAEPGAVAAAAMAKARAFADAAPLPNGITKAALAAWPLPLDQMLDHEAQGQGVLFGTEDLQEGLKAFYEKRAPRFAGR